MKRQNLLIEIGCEELPPAGLSELGDAFAATLKKLCAAAGFGSGQAHAFATPRRIAVRLDALDASQAERLITRKGPFVEKAYDEDGKPLPAALGFAKACEVAPSELQVLKDEGRLYVQKTIRGRSIKDCIATIVQHVLDQLPVAKRMRWGATDYEFIRPVHWILILYGDMPLPAKALGITGGRHTYGHRYHCPGPLAVGHADDYEQVLEQQAKVIPSFARRLQRVKSEVSAAAQLGTVQINDELARQIAAIVEWPVAVSGRFAKHFLKLPLAVISEILEKEQKFFTVCDAEACLVAEFIAVANIESTDQAALRCGYERVVAARLNDADFFINQDRKHSLRYYAKRLDQLLFHQKLGTLASKVERMADLAAALAHHLSASERSHSRHNRRADLAATLAHHLSDADNSEGAALRFDRRDMEWLADAARLCKADLSTAIVCEYPQLAGFIGGYYAQCDGEAAAICRAVSQHIKPQRAADTLPEEKIAIVLAVADRLDTLVGTFGVGEHPSGSRDPYALRRASTALIRLAVERRLDLDLAMWVAASHRRYTVQISASCIARLLEYLKERLRHYFIDHDYNDDRVAAVAGQCSLHCYDMHQRLLGLQRFMQMPQSVGLIAATKRIRNILDNNRNGDSTEVDDAVLESDAERRLYDVFRVCSVHVQQSIGNKNYLEALKNLSQLHEPIDDFFERVFVMSENKLQRNNRLALLHQIDRLFMQMADFSKLRLGE